MCVKSKFVMKMVIHNYKLDIGQQIKNSIDLNPHLLIWF